jgi:hypothetical protein
VEGNGLIGAAGDCHVLAVSHRPTNEFVIPKSLHSNLDATYSAVTGQPQIARVIIS